MGKKMSGTGTVDLPLRLIDETLPRPAYASPGACALDLYARQRTVIGAHSDGRVPLNIVVRVPDGYGLCVSPRSSLLRRRGLVPGTAPGIVDKDFAGSDDEVCAIVYNVRSIAAIIERGERIAQAYLVAMPQVSLIPYDPAHTANRGGFGSSGVMVTDHVQNEKPGPQ